MERWEKTGKGGRGRASVEKRWLCIKEEVVSSLRPHTVVP